MKKTILSLLVVLFVASSFLVSCGGGVGSSGSGDSSGGGGVAVALESVQDLPLSTGQVVDGSSTGSALVKYLGESATGMPLGKLTEEDFDDTMSLAACEMYNMTTMAISQAAQGDGFLCHIQTGIDYFASKQGIDIFDGDYHVLALSFPEKEGDEMDKKDGGGPSKIKLKVEKDASTGKIKNFEMYGCREDKQEFFAQQSIIGTAFTMDMIHSGSWEDNIFLDSAHVEGTLDEDGNFIDEVDGVETPKVIMLKHKGEGAGEGMEFDFWGSMIFTQFADKAIFEGVMSGTDTHEEDTCTFEDNIIGIAALIDGNEDDASKDDYDISLVELGDGILTGKSNGECGEKGAWNHSFTEAWLGSTAMAVDPYQDSVFYEEIEDVALDEKDEPSIGFGENSFDCTTEADATLEFGPPEGKDKLLEEGSPPEPKEGNVCEKYNLMHNHINCWYILGDDKADKEEE
ncbi:MAG: hypothetical protein ABII18_13180 [bacterium]|nr:hypothetical protein [bacterium]MBU1918389.1 hypothetical protein [bacterium]